MNTEILAAKWKQLTGEIKKHWGKLTDDDLTQIAGEKDKLLGTLEEKYGYAKQKAKDEVDSFLTKCSSQDENYKREDDKRV